jgi:hypothetical protein
MDDEGRLLSQQQRGIQAAESIREGTDGMSFSNAYFLN